MNASPLAMKPVHPGLAGLQWRTLREEDIAEVAALEAQAHAAPWSSGNFRDALGAGYETCVGVRAGRVIAYGVLMLAPGEAQILNLTVAPEARGEGIGRELLRRFVVDAERVGAEQIFLEVRGSNVAAIRLYRAEGFAPVARREGYYPGATAGAPREDALVMRRAVVPVPSDDDSD